MTFNAAGFAPQEYWTNQPAVPECRPNPSLGGHTSCGPPVSKLVPGGVVVIVADLPAFGTSFHANARVANYPASIRSTQCAPNLCPAQAVSGLLAVIRMPGGRSSPGLIHTLQLEAYFGPGRTEQLARAMRRVLEHARPA